MSVLLGIMKILASAFNVIPHVKHALIKPIFLVPHVILTSQHNF